MLSEGGSRDENEGKKGELLQLEFSSHFFKSNLKLNLTYSRNYV